MDQEALDKLRAVRATGVGRMLLLARKEFVTRVREKITAHARGDDAILPPSWSGLLPYIDIDGTRSTVLAQRAGVSKQAVGKIVRELEALGLLARLDDPDDGRAFLVVFTELGLQRLVDTHHAIDEVEAEYEAQLGPRNMAILRESLRTLVYPAGPPPD